MEAQKIKKDSDEASQSKLDEHPAKCQRTESYSYDIDHTSTNPPKDTEHFTEVLTREETHTDPEVIPTDHNRRGGPKRKNRRHRLRYKRSVFHCNSVVRSSNDNLHDNGRQWEIVSSPKVSSPNPDSQQLRVDYITATWEVGPGNKDNALVPSIPQCSCPKIVQQSKFRTNLAQLESNKRYYFRIILLRMLCICKKQVL